MRNKIDFFLTYGMKQKKIKSWQNIKEKGGVLRHGTEFEQLLIKQKGNLL